MGSDDTKNIMGKLRSGWELVRADEYPEDDFPSVQDGKHLWGNRSWWPIAG